MMRRYAGSCDRTIRATAGPRHWRRSRSTIASPSGCNRCATWPAPTAPVRTFWVWCRPPSGSASRPRVSRGRTTTYPRCPCPPSRTCGPRKGWDTSWSSIASGRIPSSWPTRRAGLSDCPATSSVGAGRTSCSWWYRGGRCAPRLRGGMPVGPWRRFLGLLGPHTPLLVEAFACALLMTVLGVSTSYFIQHLVDSVLVRSEGGLLNALGVGMVLIVLFKALFGLLRQYLVAHVGRKVDLALVSGYARHILRLPLPFFEMRRVGEILSRVNDADKVREAISGTTLTAVVDGTLVVFMLAVLWAYDVPAGGGGDRFRPGAGGQRGGVPPGRTAALPRDDGEPCRALGSPGGGRLRRGDGQGLRGRAVTGRGGGRAAGRLRPGEFLAAETRHQHEHAGDVRDGARRRRGPLVRRSPGDGRGTHDRPAHVLLHACWATCSGHWSGWPR